MAACTETILGVGGGATTPVLHVAVWAYIESLVRGARGGAGALATVI